MGLRAALTAGRVSYRGAELALVGSVDDGVRRQILVAVDGSESSLRAAAWALGSAGRHGIRLVVLYVHTLGWGASAPEVLTAMRVGNAETAQALRDEMELQARSLGLDIVVVEREGNPYSEIARVAGQLHVDGIVVAAATKFGYNRKASPAARLVRAARCPVTVVP